MAEAEAEGGPWWLAVASSAQLTAGIAWYRRGYNGSGNPALMPVKAFFVASLFVGAGATAALVAVRAAGMRRSLRRWLGAPEKRGGSSGGGGRAPTATVA
ncbi:unnamed protein product [Spirodela intermedia]|uniref:Uncharacterized protein n=1 Tax=Spirodela intermedia TaxID=51605 RepID=A0A7I8IH81_SPIIN|nr:unnamed protein product [Spirodela intermedia]CAA6657074.1 unnamed protein product [Spirodela intermedia]